MSYKPDYDKLTKDYNDTLNILSGGKYTPLRRKTELTQTGSSTSINVWADNIRPYTVPQGDKPKQQQSSFVQWNIEKTQPQLSYGQEMAKANYPAKLPQYDSTFKNQKVYGFENLYNVSKKMNKYCSVPQITIPPIPKPRRGGTERQGVRNSRRNTNVRRRKTVIISAVKLRLKMTDILMSLPMEAIFLLTDVHFWKMSLIYMHVMTRTGIGAEA